MHAAIAKACVTMCCSVVADIQKYRSALGVVLSLYNGTQRSQERVSLCAVRLSRTDILFKFKNIILVFAYVGISLGVKDLL